MVGIILFYILSAGHDYYVWQSSSKKYSDRDYVVAWHKVRFFMELIVFSTMSWYATDSWFDFFLFLSFAAWTKLTVFNIIYNILKEQKWYYLSPFSNPIDEFFKPVEKEFFIINILIWLTLLIFNLF